MSRSLPNRLVLYRDTASGFAGVGWATELIENRFKSIEVICDTDSSSPIQTDSPYYLLHQAACSHARELNLRPLETQKQRYLSEGWYLVPLNLEDPQTTVAADEFGCFVEAARSLMFRLGGNDTAVWAVVSDKTVINVQSRIPPRDMNELEYRVWKSNALQSLEIPGSDILIGELVALECGLWFHPLEIDVA